jgi:hypothetical protein
LSPRYRRDAESQNSVDPTLVVPLLRARRGEVRYLAVAGVLAVTGCGARTELSELEAGGTGNVATAPTARCDSTRPRCIVRGRACQAPSSVDAACDENTRLWSCPSGSRPYARVPQSAAPCLPFRHAIGLESIAGWGVSSLTPLPIDDDRCLWIAGSVVLTGGRRATNVALEGDPTAAFGVCPDESVIPPTPIVTLEGGDDPSILVAINGAYRTAGTTRVLYRLFRLDPSATFGAIELGGGLAHYDPDMQRILVPAPAKPFPWGLDLDLGDATLLSGDGSLAFAWGCSRPGEFLEEGCELARIDAADSIDLYAGRGTWLNSTDASRGVTIFSSGPWLASVVAVGPTLYHIYSVAFGRELRSQSAAEAMGPWSPSTLLAGCALPAHDADSFCAGPVVRREISDPMRPGELAVTYSVGTTGEPSANPDDYWPRLVWLNVP